MEEKANIIFIHKGNPEYLGYSLRQARKSNPDANIYLIGDETNNKYDFITHHNMADYFESADALAKVYQHMSTNTYQFELFCIQRWFILNEFVKKNNINQFFHADSDVLIFTDISKEFEKFKKYDFTLSNKIAGGESFWLNREALKKFCTFIENIYNLSDNRNYNKLTNFYFDHQKKGNLGGVCDMTFFKNFVDEKLANVGENSEIISNSTYDLGIFEPQNGKYLFKLKYGLKKIIWKDKVPHGELSDCRLVRLNTIHMQGSAKRYIPKVILRRQIFSLLMISRKYVYSFLRFFNLTETFSKVMNLLK